MCVKIFILITKEFFATKNILGPNVCVHNKDWCKDVKEEMCDSEYTEENCPKTCGVCPGT